MMGVKKFLTYIDSLGRAGDFAWDFQQLSVGSDLMD